MSRIRFAPAAVGAQAGEHGGVMTIRVQPYVLG